MRVHEDEAGDQAAQRRADDVCKIQVTRGGRRRGRRGRWRSARAAAARRPGAPPRRRWRGAGMTRRALRRPRRRSTATTKKLTTLAKKTKHGERAERRERRPCVVPSLQKKRLPIEPSGEAQQVRAEQHAERRGRAPREEADDAVPDDLVRQRDEAGDRGGEEGDENITRPPPRRGAGRPERARVRARARGAKSAPRPTTTLMAAAARTVLACAERAPSSPSPRRPTRWPSRGC